MNLYFSKASERIMKNKNRCTKCNKTGGKLIKCGLCKEYFCGADYYDSDSEYDYFDNECIYYYNNIHYSANGLPKYDISICGNCSRYLFKSCVLCGNKRPGYYCHSTKYCHDCLCEHDECDGVHFSDDDEQAGPKKTDYAKKDIANIKENLKLLKKKIRKYPLGDVNLINLIKEYLIYY